MATGSSITLFSFLTNILRLKSRGIYEKHIDDENFFSIYVPFMVVKWCSMLNNERLITTLAKIQPTLDRIADNPRLHYLMLMNSLPKVNDSPRWIFPKVSNT